MSDFHRSMRKKAEERAEILEKKLAALVKDREAGFAVVETLNSEVNRLTGENAALRSDNEVWKSEASRMLNENAELRALLREARELFQIPVAFWTEEQHHAIKLGLVKRIDAALGEK